MKAVFALLLLAALSAAGLLMGGSRLAFALPSYGILSLAAWLCLFDRSPNHPARGNGCLLSAFVFFSYFLSRAVLSPVEYLARADLFMALGSLMVYLVVAFHLTSARWRMSLVVCLLILGVAHTAVGAIQFSKGDNFMPFDLLKRADYGVRASGFYGCPNHLAGFLHVAALMGLAVACWSRWALWVRLFIGYLAVVCAGGLAMTGSRGGYLSAIAGMLVLIVMSIIVLRKQNRRLFWRVVGINALLAIVLTFAAERIISRNFFLQTRSSSVLAEDIRPLIWKAGVQQFKLNPVWGTGSGTFLYYGRQFRAEGVTKDPVHAHNDYLQLLAECGVAGMLCFLFFVGAHLRSATCAFSALMERRTSVSHSGSNTVALNIGALASSAAYAVHSFVDFNLHIPANTLLMAFIFAVLSTPPSKSSPAAAPVKQIALPAWTSRLLLAVAAAWMCAAGLPTLRSEYCAERAFQALCESNYSECEWYADQGLALTSKNPYLHYYKGEARAGMAEDSTEPHAKLRLFEQSVADYRSAIALFPHEEHFALGLGWALDALGRTTEAEPVFRIALELDPHSPEVLFAYAAHLRQSGNQDGAREFFAKAATAGSPGAAFALQALSKAQAERPELKPHFRQPVKARPQ